MKHMKWVIVVALSFTLLLANTFTSIAQSNVTSLNGTEWADATPLDFGFATAQAFFKFEDKQKAIFRVVGIQGDRLQLGIDNDMLLFYGTTKLTMNHLPPAVGIIERIGKYKQDGNSVTVEFPDRVMNITIKDNGLLSGETIFKNPNIKKEQLREMYKISPK